MHVGLCRALLLFCPEFANLREILVLRRTRRLLLGGQLLRFDLGARLTHGRLELTDAGGPERLLAGSCHLTVSIDGEYFA